MQTRFIKNVSAGTWNIILRKVPDQAIRERIKRGEFSALGVCQGLLADILVAGDMAEKSSNVWVAEIQGTCPQHIVCLGIFGDTSAVENALEAVTCYGASEKN
ncbi:MAG: BMC domain protein [Dethiosulfovibrio peptidovorans]|nr:MAG: BMC domain protein [Dethiosulfovibrio peptidovorans]